MRRSLRYRVYIHIGRRTILELEDFFNYSERLGFWKEGTMATTDKKLTDNPVVLRILGLIKKKGKKEKDLTEYLKISSGSISGRTASGALKLTISPGETL